MLAIQTFYLPVQKKSCKVWIELQFFTAQKLSAEK